jgi:hypothetical protein
MALVAVGLVAGAVVWSLSGNDAEKLAMSEPEPQAAPPSAAPESGATLGRPGRCRPARDARR